MNIHHVIFCSALVTVLGVPAAMAQQDPAVQPGMGTETQPGIGGAQTGMSAGQGITADQLEDKKVVNNTGEEIGEVEKIVRSKDDNKLHAVVEVGGVLGMGEKEVAMPLSELSMQNDQLMSAQATSREQIESKSEYKEDQYEELSENEQIDRSEFAAFEAGGAGQHGGQSGVQPGGESGMQPGGQSATQPGGQSGTTNY